MHPRIQQRCDYVAAEHQRVARAVTAICIPVDSEMLTPFYRFKIVPAARGWHIADSITGQVMDTRDSHKAACTVAQRLERLQWGPA
jgi:hypothetical protein